MLDSLPDAALPFWAYKSRCLFGPTKADASRSAVGVAVSVFTASAQGPERTKCT